MSFTDRDCGITVPHIHTGELTESHYIQYWCPDEVAWIDRKTCSDHIHKRARTQTTSTENIELYPDYSQDLLDFMHLKLRNALEERFLNGN